jgi:hypothetical protein
MYWRVFAFEGRELGRSDPTLAILVQLFAFTLTGDISVNWKVLK